MSKRKNILVLCPDEMKASALGCYGQVLPVSPFIDGLADRATVFEQCHTVHPKCVPSRAAFLTAQYPHVNGHRTLQMPVRRHEINLVRTLRENGYQTGLFGKNHTVDSDTMQETFHIHSPGSGGGTLEARKKKMADGSYFVGEDEYPLESFRDHLITSCALDWVGEQDRADQPFFAWVNWNSPHPPYSVPKEFYGTLDRAAVELPPVDDPSTKPPYQKELARSYGTESMSDDDWRDLIATYLEMSRFIDTEVERVFGFLEEKGLAEDTIVVLWSDHGDFAGEHQLPEKWDTSFYDCITRVPFVLFDPSDPTGRRIPALVETIDILPTVLAKAGIELPKGIQGMDLGSLIDGSVEAVRDVVFCQGGQEPEMFDRVIPPNEGKRPCLAYQLKQDALYRRPDTNIRAKMIRGQRWKYIYHMSDFEELYDLETDPDEVRNLAPDPGFREVLEAQRMRMMKKLVEAETVEPHQTFLES